MSHECPADSLRFAAIHLSIRGMLVSVNVQTVYPRKVAAVRREVEPGAVGSVWGPAVGKVWDFIRSQPGFWTDGHNIFLYHHPKQPGAPEGVKLLGPAHGAQIRRVDSPPGYAGYLELPAIGVRQVDVPTSLPSEVHRHLRA